VNSRFDTHQVEMEFQGEGHAVNNTHCVALLPSDRNDGREARPIAIPPIRKLVENVTQCAREYTLYFRDLENELSHGTVRRMQIETRNPAGGPNVLLSFLTLSPVATKSLMVEIIGRPAPTVDSL
jgi:hypothetical protein